MIHDGGKGLEERVRILEAGIEGHGRELERIRSRLGLTPEGMALQSDEGQSRFTNASADGVVDPERGGREAGQVGGSRNSGGRGDPWTPFGLPLELANLRRWEWWLNKVGIALFLMGIVFLFKFSWDRGWLQVLLTPVVRVGIGMLLGTALVWVGLRVYADRRAFAQVVLGGGIGTYYITGFGAYGMLGLFSYPVAFAFMAAVTGLAGALALRQDGAALAVIGVSGGFATPFLLYDGDGALAGLVLYTGIVLAGAMGMYFYKGWRSLLTVAGVGYWTVLFMGYADAVAVDAPPIDGGVALQAGVLFGWISLWLVPTARETLRLADPRRWRAPQIGARVRGLPGDDGSLARLLSFASPLILLWLTQLLWTPDRTTMGLVALGVAACHGFSWAGFRRVGGGGAVSYTQAIVTLLLSTLSLAFLLEGGTLLLVLAAEAAALHLLSRRLSDRNVAAIAHALSGLVGLWLLGRLASILPYEAGSGRAVVGPGALTDLLVLLLILASSWTVGSGRAVYAYRVAAHAALLAWFCGELALLPGPSDAYVTVAWGITGAGMFVAGLRRDHAYLIKGGVATLFLVVAKLCLWDLADLDAVWRVMLFLGFGGLFLLLSYHLRNLWRPHSGATPEVPPSRVGHT